jgi:CheY-like chemotaxis protein
MSHEIRTPMNAIIGMSELAAREFGRQSGLARIDAIRRAGASLLAIVNDILDFSKIESGAMILNDRLYESASLLNDAITIIRIRLEDKNIEFVVDVDPTIPQFMKGDETRVRQVLINLLSNAAKYTTSGFIRFSVRCRHISDETVELAFEIEDSGVGIRAEDMPSLFKDFVRIERRVTNVEGTGLGLVISRNLCRAMGGDITVKSEYEKGSVFIATLLQGRPDYAPMGALKSFVARRGEIVAAPFTAPDFRALIVDDIETNLHVAEGLLAPYKMRIDTVLSGEESVELARTNEYDLIFMDHMMPGMDGMQATAAIRALALEKRPTIVALTANAVSGMRETFLANGFDDFLAKPIELAKLNDLIKRRVPKERRKEIEPSAPPQSVAMRSPILGVNTARGIELTGGLQNYKNVLAIFCGDAKKRIPLLNDQSAKADVKLFTTQVHALKSASATIGAEELSKRAAALEGAGANNDQAAIEGLIGAFNKELARLLEAIEEALNNDRASNAAATEDDEKTTLARLEALKIALQKEDMRQIDAITSQIEPQTGFADERLTQISEYILVSEFGKAIELIDQFIASRNA